MLPWKLADHFVSKYTQTVTLNKLIQFIKTMLYQSKNGPGK